MSSNIRSTRRARLTRRAAIAAIAAAGLGAGLAAGTGTAFAADGPNSTLNGTVIVGSTLTIHPSVQAFSITAVPGVPVQAQYTLVIHSTDSSGYDLSQALTSQFGSIPDNDWALGQATYDQHQDPYTTTQVPYDAAGDAVELYGTSTLSGGNIDTNSGTGAVVSDSGAGTDTITTDVQLSLPVGYPGSPVNGWTGAYTLALIGR